ncbi:uncharacterized protein LOC131153934 [Malania oleifera]|uniref:uncharacterized protein LOC131153934 n=1 Tax=Malania oleifera TaxID=397392 RepID=UPI0025AE4AD6|nr:uncharacterized protein LOC131153934 [Malania oleifera]
MAMANFLWHAASPKTSNLWQKWMQGESWYLSFKVFNSVRFNRRADHMNQKAWNFEFCFNSVCFNVRRQAGDNEMLPQAEATSGDGREIEDDWSSGRWGDGDSGGVEAVGRFDGTGRGGCGGGWTREGGGGRCSEEGRRRWVGWYWTMLGREGGCGRAGGVGEAAAAVGGQGKADEGAAVERGGGGSGGRGRDGVSAYGSS